ncbi:MAG: phosphatase PAP2 family protein [Rikenellaceae bacterium]|nr:phosphatase PAP2 family protein [Rikenellaceae bacterium]
MERLDEAIFLALNFDGGSAIDQAMFIISGRLTWLPLYLLIIYLIWRRYGWRTTIYAVLMMAAAVGLADQICNLFKNGLQMLRPNHDADVMPLMHFPLRDGVPYINKGLYGTVSAHASTTTAIAYLAHSFIHERLWRTAGAVAAATVAVSFVRRRWFTIVAFVWVAMICYSRIYLGAHFPSQVLAGIALGVLIGAAGVFVARRCGLYNEPQK